MNTTYGARDIVRNPSLLRIDAYDIITIEDKRAHKTLGVFLGTELSNEFFKYRKKEQMLKAAKNIKENASTENSLLEGTIHDQL